MPRTLFRAVCVGMLGAAACSGPLPLNRAIRPEDSQAWSRMTGSGTRPKDGFYAARAGQTGRSVEAVARADADLPSDRNPFNAARDADAVSRGAVVFQSLCARCHGEDARGRGPDASPAQPCGDFHGFGKRVAVTLHGGAPRAWFRRISDGYGRSPGGTGPAMPAFKDVLAREQIWDVITYLQSLDVHQPAPQTGN